MPPLKCIDMKTVLQGSEQHVSPGAWRSPAQHKCNCYCQIETAVILSSSTNVVKVAVALEPIRCVVLSDSLMARRCHLEDAERVITRLTNTNLCKGQFLQMCNCPLGGTPR